MNGDDKQDRNVESGSFSELSKHILDTGRAMSPSDFAESKEVCVDYGPIAVSVWSGFEVPQTPVPPKFGHSTTYTPRIPLTITIVTAILGLTFCDVSESDAKRLPGFTAIGNHRSLDKRSYSPNVLYSDAVLVVGQNRNPNIGSLSVVRPVGTGRPSETRPQVGKDLVFGLAELRYCLAEDIRLEGARGVTDVYNATEVDRFNSMVGDYNTHCGNFRYHSGDLEQAKREIEPFRTLLLAEGRASVRTPSTGKKVAGAGSDAGPAATTPKNLCEAPPRNGNILKEKIQLVEAGHRLTIKNGSSSDAIIKLRDASTGSLAVSFFVKRSMSASVDGIPDGQYRVQFGYGSAMTLDCGSFIAPTAKAFNDALIFITETTATQVVTQEMSFTLFGVPGGNVRPVAISAEEFNGD